MANHHPTRQIHETQQYNDNGQWVQTYNGLKQMEKSGQAKGMSIPRERPESPNQRLMAAGATPQPGARMPQNFNMESLPSTQQLGYQQEAEIPQSVLNGLFARGQQPPQMPQSQYNQPSQQVCRIVEGAQVYHPMKMGGFMEGGPVILCKHAGNAQGVYCQTDFAIKGIRNCYVVQLHEKTVNLQVINNSPNLWTKLVEVQGAMGQSVLVSQSHLRTANLQQQPSSSRMLNDSQQQVRRPMTTNNNQPQQQSRILKG